MAAVPVEVAPLGVPEAAGPEAVPTAQSPPRPELHETDSLIQLDSGKIDESRHFFVYSVRFEGHMNEEGIKNMIRALAGKGQALRQRA